MKRTFLGLCVGAAVFASATLPAAAFSANDGMTIASGVFRMMGQMSRQNSQPRYQQAQYGGGGYYGGGYGRPNYYGGYRPMRRPRPNYGYSWQRRGYYSQGWQRRGYYSY